MSTGLGNDTTTFIVVAGAADHLTITSSSGNLASGGTRDITAEIRDANGNLETGDNSTSVDFTKTLGAGTVTGLTTATAANGIATDTVTGDLAGSITLQAHATGLTNDTTTFTIVPGAADHLTITSATTNLASGTTRGITAEIRDAAGNLRSGDNTTSIDFTKTAGSGTVTGLTTATAANGIATDTVTGDLAGSITLQAHATGLSDDTTTFTIVPGAADHLTITSSTANLASGATRDITAEIRDANGNLRSSDNSTSVDFTKTLGTGTVSGLTTVTAVNGVATGTVTGMLAGSITLQAQATGLTDDTTTFTIVPGAADHLTITSSTANLASGATRDITAEVRDANGNLRTTDNSTSITFTKTSGTGTVTGLGSPTAVNGVATDTVSGVAAGSITLTAHSGLLTDGTTTFTIVPGVADHLTITSTTTNLASGTTRDITAEVRDTNGNLLAGDNSTSVSFSKTSGAGTVTGLGSAAAVNGVATDTVTGVLAGSITLTAHSGLLTDGTTTFTIVPGTADHLTITSSASNLSSGATRGITAEIRDANNNLITTDNSTSVSFSKTGGTGTVTGLGPATASAGVATDTVTGVLAGSITLKAHSGSLTDGTTTFTVVPGAADHLTITSAATNLASGTTRGITAEVRDTNGNLLAGDNSTSVTFSKTGGSGIVTGLGSVTAVNGVATDTATGLLAGPITLTAHSGLLTDDTTTFTIVPGTADHLTITSSTANLISGATRDITAEVHDANNNLIATDNSTSVTFSKTSGSGTITGLTTVTAVSGIATDTVTALAAGSITLTAHSGSFTDGTTTFTIDPASVDAGNSTVVASGPTTSTDTGSTNTVTVTVKDAQGNLIAGSHVVLNVAGGNSLISPDPLTGANTNGSGVATFTVSDTVAESAVYSATATGTLITQTAGVTYTPGAAHSLAIVQQPTNVGVNQLITPAVKVKVLDVHGNRVDSSIASIDVAKNAGSPGGTLTGTLTRAANGVNGTATFNDLQIDTTGTGFSLDFSSTGLVPVTSNTFNVLQAPGLAFSNTSANSTYYPPATQTIYFRPGTGGTFTVTATPSGQPSYNFPSLTGWSRSISGNAATYTLTTDTTGSTNNAVTYFDGVSTSGASTFDVIPDTTLPTSGGVTAPSGYDTTGSFNVSVTYATDTGSDIQSESLQRYVKTLSGNACSGSFTADGAPVAISGTGNQAQSSLPAGCYEWILTATDNVGNQSTFTSSVTMVDPTAPSAPTLISVSPLGTGFYYSGSGSTIYVKSGTDNTNNFQVTASSTDADTNVASYVFPAITGFTKSVTGATATYTPTTTIAGSDGGSGAVTATNGAGSTSASGFTLTVIVDGTAPASTGFANPATDTYSTDGTANVSWGAFTDGGSGMLTVTIKRQFATLAANTCGGTWTDDSLFSQTLTTASTSIPGETGLASGTCFRYVITGSDHLGNQTQFTSANVMVDTTAPATPTLTSLVSAGTSISASGSTIYFQPGADNTNSFTVTADSTGDPETGLKSNSWVFPAIPGFGTPSISGNQATYTAASPTAGQGGSGNATVQNNALLTSLPGAAFTVVADNTAPAGGGFSGVPQYSNDGNVSFSMTLFTDGGSGVASQTVQRQIATPTAGACPAGGWTDDGAPTAASTSFSASGLTDGSCYRWLFGATDKVGNATDPTTLIGGPVLVDMSAPGAPTLSIAGTGVYFVGPATAYYNPSTGGSFTVSASSTASASGIKDYTFPDVLHGFSRTTPSTTNPATYTFGITATDTSGDVVARSNALKTSSTTFSLVGDTTGPLAPTIGCSAACSSNASVSVTLSANGDGSGSGVKEIRYTTDGTAPTLTSTLYAGAFNVSSTTTINAAAIDNLNNVGSVSTQTVTIDNTPPNATTADVSGSTLNIHFDKALANIAPATSAFAVTYTTGGLPTADPVTNVSISGATATLTLQNPVTNPQSSSVTYTQPGANQLQDSLANFVATFTKSITGDTTAPSVLSASAAGTTAILQFDEPLDPASVPATGAFVATMNPGSVANAVTGVAISGSQLTLTLGTAVSGFQSASVVYTQPGTNPIEDPAGNLTAGFTKTITLDTTPPHATAAEINADTLITHFDEALNSGSTPATSAFTVSLAGLPVSVTNVSISGSDATLTLAAAAVGGQSVSLTYTQPGSGGRFQDAAGNPTTTFSLGVTNLTSGGGGVTVQFVSASPADGSSQVSVAGPIVLTANEYAAWSNLQLDYISAIGDAPTTTPLAGGVGQSLSVPFSSSTAGLYTLTGTVSDGSTSVNFITHFTIWLLTGPGAPTPTAKTAYPGQSDSLTLVEPEGDGRMAGDRRSDRTRVTA